MRVRLKVNDGIRKKKNRESMKKKVGENTIEEVEKSLTILEVIEA